MPFRSVASRLARGGAGQMDGQRLDVLRSATFARLSQVLHQAADARRLTVTGPLSQTATGYRLQVRLAEVE